MATQGMHPAFTIDRLNNLFNPPITLSSPPRWPAGSRKLVLRYQWNSLHRGGCKIRRNPAFRIQNPGSKVENLPSLTERSAGGWGVYY